MALSFTKATKSRAKLRLALFGPSGAGKTYTALRLATGIGGRIAVIDTERGSASKYADRFEFDVLELPQRNIDTYCEGIRAAAGYSVLIIDSLTHAWHELLDEVERLARARYGGNTWSAWSEGTPKQRRLVDAILGFDGHIIATMRSKTEWAADKDDRGKTRPVRIGLAPEQGKGIEYEFDLLMEISPDHVGNIIKDRTGKYQDMLFDPPDEALGADLAAWLSQAPEAEPESPRDAPPPDSEPPARTANGTPVAHDDRPRRPLPERPYPAEIIRRALQQAAAKGPQRPASDKQQVAVRASLEALFDTDAAMKRHSVTEYVYGKTSTTELTAGEASALLDWASVKEEQDGKVYYSPSQHAPSEAAAIVAAFEEAQGQIPMEGLA